MRSQMKAGVLAAGLVLLSCAGEPVERDLAGLWIPSALEPDTSAQMTLAETDGATVGGYELHWQPVVNGERIAIGVYVKLLVREDPFGGFSLWHSDYLEETGIPATADERDFPHLLCSSCTASSTASSTAIECETASAVRIADDSPGLVVPEFALGCRFERVLVR